MNFLNQFRPYYNTILIVGHHSMNRTIAWSLCNLSWDQMQQLPSGFGATMVLEYEPARGWSMVTTYPGKC